ncbi:MAG: hypothetical protein QME81_08805, partial [bacterium]|nr:hypothetical protein [bacterium]
MSGTSKLVSMVAVVWLLLGVSLAQAMPNLMNYQGRLTDAGGAAVSDGSYTIVFRICDAETSGNKLWEESQTVTIKDGLFYVVLGKTTPIDLSFDKDYWFALKVGDDSEMTPRQRMTSAGYAFTAGSLGGGVVNVDAAGNIGIGTTSPAEKLDVAGNIHAGGSIASGNSITIDGTNDKITASGGTLSFDDENLVTTGTVTAAAFAGDGSGLSNISGTTDSDWTESGTNVYRVSGNVGVGTTEPAHKLDVISSGEGLRVGNENSWLKVWTGGNSRLSLGDGQGREAGFIAGDENDTGENVLIIAGADDAGNAPVYTIFHQSGNVGIGTMQPGEALEVAGTVKATAFAGDGSGLTGIAGTADSDWAESGTDVYRETGNVGIGTTSPGEKLEVAGTVKATAFAGDGSGLTGIAGTADNDWVESGADVYRET